MSRYNLVSSTTAFFPDLDKRTDTITIDQKTSQKTAPVAAPTLHSYLPFNTHKAD
jgi:hypothetical protein